MLDAALGLFSSGAGLVSEYGELVQGHFQQREQIRWTQKQYRLDIFSFAIDMLNQVKDEVKELYETYSGRIDNLMVVHTLLLSLGFATMGYNDSMFPKNVLAPGQSHFWHRLWLVFFATVQALGMVLPFWAVASLVRCKQHLEIWLDTTLRELHKHFTVNLQSQETLYEHSERPEAETEADLDKKRDALVRNIAKLVGQYNGSFDEMWCKKCARFYLRSTSLFWWCVILAVTQCGIQMSVFLKHHYQKKWDGSCTDDVATDEECVDAPEVWVIFVAVLVVGCTIVLSPMSGLRERLCPGVSLPGSPRLDRNSEPAGATLSGPTMHMQLLTRANSGPQGDARTAPRVEEPD